MSFNPAAKVAKVDQFGRDRALKNRMVIAKLMTPDEIAKAKLIIANLKNK